MTTSVVQYEDVSQFISFFEISWVEILSAMLDVSNGLKYEPDVQTSLQGAVIFSKWVPDTHMVWCVDIHFRNCETLVSGTNLKILYAVQTVKSCSSLNVQRIQCPECRTVLQNIQ